ncbi:HD domain-containing phosphohydrolase [Shewanella sp. NIFS-20-20]|uniref:response regulator n=1 Tax=Shewanella sp. NIFS-20-20 TaxID=2853806 RepID=UPI001C456EDC|nr:HD domain-containing phosphohydrolase [Shewanella sp. NIFS-20-20]MBV7315363.1 response regulator [Shewanella sp. NIFS-20-20]
MANILVVDDMKENLTLMKRILEGDGHQVFFAQSGQVALDRIHQCQPSDIDLILLDVMMPGMTGYQVCEQLKLSESSSHIPIIFVTAMSAEPDETRAFAAGGVDYITKPISAGRLLARVKNHLSLVRLEELEATQLLIVQKLGRAAEYKNNETGYHVIRMSHYSRLLGKAYGLSHAQCDMLYHAAAMHDVGKIGTPDHILLKPDCLDDHEWQIMKMHPVIGAEIIGDHDIPLLQAARDIALTHHEKWDGSGYPFGLRGKDIPIFGRIVAIADVFDALSSCRSYKHGWSFVETCQAIEDGAGSQFDPELVALFLQPEILAQVKQVQLDWQENHPDEDSVSYA